VRFTGEAGRLPEDEQAKIFEVAAEVGVPACFLAAIRIAENGGPGREFGVLSERADTYESQAKIAALSIRNNTFRYVIKFKEWPVDANTGGLSESFTKFMGARWAPVGATNDPTNLNRHWAGNVWRAYKESGIV
jgi:hypothetical protein